MLFSGRERFGAYDRPCRERFAGGKWWGAYAGPLYLRTEERPLSSRHKRKTGDVKSVGEDFMTTREAAKRWGVSERTVQAYCRRYGDQIGAFKDNGWRIPPNACPPYKIDGLRAFLRDYCRHKDNPFKVFPYQQSRSDAMLGCLLNGGMIAFRDENHPLSIDNVVIAPTGWDLLFGERGSGRRGYVLKALNLQPQFNLLNVNL